MLMRVPLEYRDGTGSDGLSESLNRILPRARASN